MRRGRLPPRLYGEAVLPERNHAPEDADVGRAVRPERRGSVVVVEPEAGPRQPPVDGAPAAEVERRQIPGVDPVRAWRMRVGVDQTVAERELRDHRRRPLLAGPDLAAAELRGLLALPRLPLLPRLLLDHVDAGQARLGDPAAQVCST